MPTGPVHVYGGVNPPQGVPITLVPTALGMALDGPAQHSVNLPMASLFDHIQGSVLANTTDKGLMRVKNGKWKQVE